MRGEYIYLPITEDESTIMILVPIGTLTMNKMLRLTISTIVIVCMATVKSQAASPGPNRSTSDSENNTNRSKCEENDLDPGFLNSFQALPEEIIFALLELEEELRLPDTEVGENEILIEMAVAEVLCKHIERLPSEKHFHLPFHKGKRVEMSDVEFLDHVWEEQVTIPCAPILRMYDMYGEQLKRLCGGAKLGCQPFCPVGQFMDYYETCTRISNLQKQHVYAYTNMIRKMKIAHKRCAFTEHDKKHKTI